MKAKVNNPNTRSGKLKMPFSSVKRYQGGVKKFALGGETDSESIGEARTRMLREARETEPKKEESFGERFARERKLGAKTFEYKGKQYTTDVKGSKPAPARDSGKLPVSEEVTVSGRREPLARSPRLDAMRERAMSASSGQSRPGDAGRMMAERAARDRRTAEQLAGIMGGGPGIAGTALVGAGLGTGAGMAPRAVRAATAGATRRAIRSGTRDATAQRVENVERSRSATSRAIGSGRSAPAAPAATSRAIGSGRSAPAAPAATSRAIGSGRGTGRRATSGAMRPNKPEKKFAKGGGVESKGKTRGRFV